MTGTDKTQNFSPCENMPAVILVSPQMGENIGGSARAMLNCGLNDLRLIAPRDGWPNEKAAAMSSGALDKMPPVQVFDTTEEAVADCHYIYATTARPRDMVKTVFTARSAAADIRNRQAEGQKTALLFGAERTGLTNEDIALAHAVITIPLNPAFSSLNLAQGVLLCAYEWAMAADNTPKKILATGDSLPAPHKELDDLFVRLERELETHHFFRSPDMKPSIVRNLKSMLVRADLTDQEVRTFHGIISALTGKKSAQN